jgi:hypothetical protein
VLSDGGWADTRAGVERIRRLAELGVPTIHLSIGIAPLSVECDRITVITGRRRRSTTSPPTRSPRVKARHRRDIDGDGWRFETLSIAADSVKIESFPFPEFTASGITVIGRAA